MGRHAKKTRERARELYLTGESASIAEIARRVGVKSHTVARWKKDEDWDRLLLRIEKRAAEQLAERIATERVSLNEQHFKGWSVIFSQTFKRVQDGNLDTEQIRNLERLAGVLERTQRGQRLARGLSLDGKTEEQLRAEFEAEGRALADLFFDVVKEKVPDERVRDEIARALMERLPMAEEITS